MAHFGHRLISIVLVSIFVLLASAKETQTQEYVPFDPNFGVNGVLTIPAVSGRTIYCCNHQIHVLDDGRILVALSMGDSEFEANSIGIFRFNGRGELDPTFGQDGFLSIDWEDYTTQSRITSISTDQFGRIIVTSQTHFYPGSSDSSWGIAVLTAAGSLEYTFGMYGYKTVLYSGNESYAAAAIADANSNILVAGNIGGPCPCTVRLTRFLPSGDSEIPSIQDFPGYTSPSVMQDTFGRYIVAATSDSNPSQRAIWRLHPSGELDTSFGNGGVVIDSFEGVMPTGSAYLQSDNKIVLFHYYIRYGVPPYTFPELIVTRFTEDGALDTSYAYPGYGIGGQAHIYWQSMPEWEMRNKFIDSQDRVVTATQYRWTSGQHDIQVSRLSNSGHSDLGINFSLGNETTETIAWSIDEMPDGDLLILAGVNDTPTLIRLDIDDPPELIRNPGFEYQDITQASRASNWVGTKLTKDKRICNKISSPNVYAHNGKCAFRFNGSSNENSQISQVIKPAPELLQPGTPYTFTAWINGSSVLGKVVVYYADGTKQAFSVRIGPSDVYQQFMSAPFFLAKTASKFKISFKYTQTTKTYIDDIALIPNSARRDALLPVPPPPALSYP